MNKIFAIAKDVAQPSQFCESVAAWRKQRDLPCPLDHQMIAAGAGVLMRVEWRCALFAVAFQIETLIV